VQALNQPFAAVTTEVGIGPFALLCKGHYLRRIAVIGAGRSESPQSAQVTISVFGSKVEEGPQRSHSIYLIGRLVGILAENSNHSPHGQHLLRPYTMPIVRMRWARRRSTTCAMHPTYRPAAHRRIFA
jgi:hypothetical protein